MFFAFLRFVSYLFYQLRVIFVFPPSNHLANGGLDQSSTLLKDLNQCNSSLAASPQNLFGSDLAISDISKYFEEEFSDIDQVRKHVQKFNGDPLNLQDVKNFILYLFVTKQKFIHSQRPIYHHFTTAVNTKNIQFVFTSVKETILRKNLSALMLQ